MLCDVTTKQPYVTSVRSFVCETLIFHHIKLKFLDLYVNFETI